jgi:hypothetical protein
MQRLRARDRDQPFLVGAAEENGDPHLLAASPLVIPGWCASTRPQMRNCASVNLEIPGSR